MRALVVILAMTLCLAMAWSKSGGAMEPNSFLVRHVSSVKELADQIRKEPVVAQRYARHYNTNAYLLADYFEQNLRLTRLPKTGTYTVFHVRSSGQILMKNLTFKKGTLIFADLEGRPVLKVSCGNPMMKTTLTLTPAAPPVAIIAVADPMASPEIALEPTDVLADLPEVVAGDVVPPTTTPEITMPEVVTDAPELPTEVTPETVVPAEPPFVATGGPTTPFSAFIPFAPLFGFTITQGRTPPANPSPPVPEPASLLALAVGLSALYTGSRGASKRLRKSNERHAPSK